jgi:hypothetical protein
VNIALLLIHCVSVTPLTLSISQFKTRQHMVSTASQAVSMWKLRVICCDSRIFMTILNKLHILTNEPGYLSCIALGYGLGDRGFETRQWLEIFLFTTASRPALGPTQPPKKWVSGSLSLGVKRPGREADRSPPSSAEVKECVEIYHHSPIRLHGMVLSLKCKGRVITLPLN